jgi:hypothetical protein
MFFYGLAVGYLLEMLPEISYDNYTKFVFVTCRKSSHELTVEEIRKAHVARIFAHRQFKEIYYKWMLERISHGAPEILLVGALALLFFFWTSKHRIHPN